MSLPRDNLFGSRNFVEPATFLAAAFLGGAWFQPFFGSRQPRPDVCVPDDSIAPVDVQATSGRSRLPLPATGHVHSTLTFGCRTAVVGEQTTRMHMHMLMHVARVRTVPVLCEQYQSNRTCWLRLLILLVRVRTRRILLE